MSDSTRNPQRGSRPGGVGDALADLDQTIRQLQARLDDLQRDAEPPRRRPLAPRVPAEQPVPRTVQALERPPARRPDTPGAHALAPRRPPSSPPAPAGNGVARADATQIEELAGIVLQLQRAAESLAGGLESVSGRLANLAPGRSAPHRAPSRPPSPQQYAGPVQSQRPEPAYHAEEPPAVRHEEPEGPVFAHDRDDVATLDVGPFADLVDLRGFETSLMRLPGVEDVYVHSFGGGRAAIDVTLPDPYALIDLMRRHLPYPFEARELPDGAIGVQLLAGHEEA